MELKDTCYYSVYATPDRPSSALASDFSSEHRSGVVSKWPMNTSVSSKTGVVAAECQFLHTVIHGLLHASNITIKWFGQGRLQ